MSVPLSPLQEVQPVPGVPRLFVKREDLIEPGGGNKVRRFQAFFEKHGIVDKVVALSDPGSHTFQILLHFLNRSEGGGAKQLLFLERSVALTDYLEEGRKQYLSNPNVTASQAPTTLQLLKYFAYKWLPIRGVKTIGIGGHVRLNPNPSEAAFEECVRQLREYDVKGGVCHLFPIASGNMLDGFLHRIDRSVLAHHTFIGVMTGDRLAARLLRLKYRKRRNVVLIQPHAIKPEQYRMKAEQCYRHTGVWLDPVHTIHLWDALESQVVASHATVVLWITSPYITN